MIALLVAVILFVILEVVVPNLNNRKNGEKRSLVRETIVLKEGEYPHS